jgi:hypothetical protein
MTESSSLLIPEGNSAAEILLETPSFYAALAWRTCFFVGI